VSLQDRGCTQIENHTENRRINQKTKLKMTEDSNKQTRVQISVYAAKLKNVAGAFKGTSDPYAVVTILAGGPHEIPEVLGKTEVYVRDVFYSFGLSAHFSSSMSHVVVVVCSLYKNYTESKIA
jgi:hypothetical protein